jgi:threonine dehydrogenase-like Zn-dependent dehydrogenase
MKSKAMVLEEFNKPLVPREFEVEPLREGQVLVKVLAAGVCGSDVHISRGEDPRIQTPLIPGHEGVGVVVETEGTVKTVQGERLVPGDVILWNRGVSCGKCYYCQVLKEPSLCENRQVYGISCRVAGDSPLNGCYSEYIVLLARTGIFKVNRDIDTAILVSASCSGATVAHAFDLVPPAVGDTVVVQGPGPLGIFAVAFARAHGAGEIIVIGGSEDRLSLCRKFGATGILNRNTTSPEERSEYVRMVTAGRGADLVVEAVGLSAAFTEGIGLLRRGGTYLSTGYAQPAGNVTLDPYQDLVVKNLRIQGVWVSDVSHTLRALCLVSANLVLFKEMVTHRFPLEEANDALSAMADRKALKAVIIP